MASSHLPVAALLLLLLVLPAVSAFSLQSGFTLNATVTNASMTFQGVTLDVDRWTAETHYIYLENVSYVNGDLAVAIFTPINWSTRNRNIDSAAFPYLSFSSTTVKRIASNLSHTVNATVLFTVADCDTAGTITYRSHTGAYTATFNPGAYTCSANVVTVSSINLEPANGSNEFTIAYNGAVLETCDGALDGLFTFGSLLPIVILLIMVSVVFVFLFGGEAELAMGSAEENTGAIIAVMVIVGIGAVIIMTIAGGSC